MNEKELILIPLTKDFMFKRVFSLNLNIFKKFLISVLRLDINPKDVNIILENVELTKSVRKEYRKTVDILVTLSNPKHDNNISIDVEVNSSRFDDIKFRNVLYHEKISTTYVEEGSNLKNLSNYFFFQLNLNVHKFKDNVGEKIFSYREVITNEELTPNLKIIHKSLDYYYELYYTSGKNVSEDVIWLSLLSAKTFEELNEMSGLIMSKKEKENFVRSAKEASRDKLILSEWESDKLADMVEHITIENAKKEEKEQNTNEIIKSMLKKNISIEDVSEITGKTIDEIKNIENELNTSE